MKFFYRKATLLLLSVIVIADISSGQKRQYTMAEAVNGLATTLAPQGLKDAQWRPGTDDFYWREGDSVRIYFADENELGGLLSRDIDAPEEWSNKPTWVNQDSWFYRTGDTLTKMFTGYQYGIDSLEKSITDKNGKPYEFISIDRMHRVNIRNEVLPKDAANLRFCPTTNDAAFTTGNNLCLIKKWGEYTQITNDTNRNIINGQPVHRNEFGIDKGIFFSPKGNYLAYYRMDQTMVKDYPVIDWSVIPATVTNIKYPMAGDSSHQVTVRVYNIAMQKTIGLKTGAPKDQYLTCVTWSTDEQYIYIAILNRAQNHLWLNQYSATTGEKLKTLFEETDDKYVEPQHPLSFLRGSNTQFIWWSQRDGYMHLWLYDMTTVKIKCLTPGDYVVNELIGFCKRTGEVLFTSAKESPLEKHGYAVSWTTGKMRRLDTEPGTHTYTASDDGEYLFDTFSNETDRIGSISSASSEWFEMESEQADSVEKVRVIKRSVIRSVKGSIVKVLIDARDPLADFDRPILKSWSIKAIDGTQLHGRFIFPTKFDRRKKYPVIVYLYNGPHIQQVKNAFPASGNLWFEYLAQHGYIVWTMDGRGSSNRGLKFEQATFRHLGMVEMEDQLRGVAFLKSLPFVDSTRMGVHGWSFGGFMTTSLMLKHPSVFKVGVAGGPVMDWRMYEVMYGERYMDTPQENPEGYKDAALYDKVKNLNGKLLLIHGTQDATVVWQQSIKFMKAAVDSNVQVDYAVYPGYEHNVRGKDRVHLMQKVTDYFDEWLKP